MNKKRFQESLKSLVPRIETLLLAMGLVCTIWSKLIIIRLQKPPNLFAELTQVVYPDVLFFTAVFLVIHCLYLLKPSALSARCALVIAILVSFWSVLNTGWLTETGAQLHPSILLLLIRDTAALWPFVETHLASGLKEVVLLGVVVVFALAVFIWSFLRPRKVVALRIYHVRRVAVIVMWIIVLFLIKPVVASNRTFSSGSEVVLFSSHQYALTSTITALFGDSDSSTQTRRIPRIGERRVTVPDRLQEDLPNVVLLLLESVSHSATSLGEAEPQTTPCLTRLARQGVEFRQTRISVSHTTKAFWAVLTGMEPAMQDNYVEAVLADHPYEGLPSLLKRIGYRSAFFEMSKGSFECAPGFAGNLAFDWAWFRENLGDPSAYLGYLSGDDFRMIKPAFDWATKTSQPFFLMMTTTVAHDPYEVPEWFGNVSGTPADKFRHSVHFTDRFVERICEELKSLGLENNTILCVLGDHGNSFRTTLRGGRWWPYEEVIRVPWIIRWPGHVKPGQVIDRPCSQVDVTPTILKLIGFDISEAGFEGRDAFNLPEVDPRICFASWYANGPMGFVQGDRKIVYSPSQDMALEYDLRTDPQEKNPRRIPADEMQEIKQYLLSWKRSTQITFEPKRFRKSLLFSHWRAFCTGESAWAYYVP